MIVATFYLFFLKKVISRVRRGTQASFRLGHKARLLRKDIMLKRLKIIISWYLFDKWDRDRPYHIRLKDLLDASLMSEEYDTQINNQAEGNY